MTLVRSRVLASVSGLAMVAAVGVVSGSGAVAATDASASSRTGQVVLDWQRVAVRTIYTEGLQAPPVGALYLGFTALAMNDAVGTALKGRNASPGAAAAAAAHDVLKEYFPASTASLDTALAASLANVPDGYRETNGLRIGRAAATEMIASRADDGRGDPSIVYTVPTPTPTGVWEPPPTGMLAPWLGYVDPLVIDSRVHINGPDGLRSKAYATDLKEVRDVGSATSTVRTQAQTDTALFFTANPVSQLTLALCAYLEQNPIGLARTAKLFAVSDAAVADSAIQAWRAKFDYRFWRPFQGIQRADEDHNPLTKAEPGWVSLVNPNPPYSDYFSGHGSVVSSFTQAVRRALGNDTPLVLAGATSARSYSSLSAIEADAFMARIWAGIHFRDAMDDAYHVGHVTADRVRAALSGRCPRVATGA